VTTFGKLVKYGHQLFTNAANEIGPVVSDASKRLAGNNLACGNCHLEAGTQPYAMPMIGVWGQFPQYRAREGGVVTLEERINGCMQRSMHGRALSLDSREMKAFSAYMRWLSEGVPDGAKLLGAGTLQIKEPTRASDAAPRGQETRSDRFFLPRPPQPKRKSQLGLPYDLSVRVDLVLSLKATPPGSPRSSNIATGLGNLLASVVLPRPSDPYSNAITDAALAKARFRRNVINAFEPLPRAVTQTKHTVGFRLAEYADEIEVVVHFGPHNSPCWRRIVGRIKNFSRKRLRNYRKMSHDIFSRKCHAMMSPCRKVRRVA
jgi:hypothetical protein